LTKTATLKPRPLPQRTCVSCGTTTGKRELIRVVRSPQGSVRPDPSGKAAGRGAYVCSQPECWEQAVKKGRLERSLHVKLSAEDAQAVRDYAATLPGGDA
jgi:predicted RNA-binding protein YlxR (DUF448 family)